MSGGEMDQPTISRPGENATGSSSQQGNVPFEMPPNISPPEPMGGQPKETPGQQNKTLAPDQQGNLQNNSPNAPTTTSVPAPAPPHKPIFSYVIMIVLFLVLIVGIVLFAAWKGWIALDGLFQKPIPSPIVSISPTISPAVSSVLPTISPSTSPQTLTNVNDETRKNDLAQIKNALKDYFLANAAYPQSTDVIKTSDSASVLAQAIVPTYLEFLPDDPLAPQYYYGYKSDGQTFELTSILEDKSDASGTLIGQYNIYKITDSSTE